MFIARAAIKSIAIRFSSQHPFHHRMRRERAIQLIKLLAAGGGDRDSEPQVFATRAVFAGDRARIKRRIKLVRHMHDGRFKAIHIGPKHLDRKQAWVLDERLLRRNI